MHPAGNAPAGVQCTIAAPVGTSGKGLHRGIAATLRLLPAPADSGVRFCRTDLPGAPLIPADVANLVHGDLMRRTTLASGDARVCTIEHVAAALAALGVHNALVEMDGEEAPFLDGSAAPWVKMIREAGIVPQGALVSPLCITNPVAFEDGGAEIVALPSETFRVSFFSTSEEPLLRSQSATFEMTPDVFEREIAPARTFCFFKEVEQLRAAGLIRGGSLASAVVNGRKSVINTQLRFPDEPVRHKILDFVGDLALLGRPLLGHFLAWRSGHRSHAAFARHLRKELPA
jgi:UDP-3-O-acyl N-acetylglucosamine deacetylase